MNKTRLAMIQMAICALMWSTGGVLIKSVTLNPIAIAGYRSLMSGIVFFLYMRYTKEKFVITKSSIAIAVATSATFLTHIFAVANTTAANAIVLQYAAPVYILLYGMLVQKKKSRRSDYMVVGFTVMGIVLFFVDQLGSGSIVGNIVAVISGFFFAGTFIFTADIESHERVSGLMQSHLLTALIGLPFLLTENVIHANDILIVTIMGIGQLGIPYILFAIALKHCPPLSASLLASLEPILNPVWVFLFIGETPGIMSIVGAAIVIAAITTRAVMDANQAKRAALANSTG